VPKIIAECANCGEQLENAEQGKKLFGICKICSEEYCPMCGREGLHDICREKAETDDIPEDDFEAVPEEDDEDDDIEPLDFSSSFIDDEYEEE
jgi:hypothetical protein